MRNGLWFIAMGGIVGALLWPGPVGAQSFPGGLPACVAQLNACKSDLGTCKTDLEACQAEPTVVFPGDGVDGPPLHYTDNGDGTVTDDNTLLMWEVKNFFGVHNVNIHYSWSSSGTAADGTLFTVFLNALNHTCEGAGVTDCTATGDAACDAGVCGLGGHRDWRIPNVKELQSIVDYGRRNPSIDPTFGPTSNAFYWSLTERVSEPVYAFCVSFGSGGVSYDAKVNSDFASPFARAVGGGQ